MESDDSEISTFYYEYDKAGNRTKRADDPTSPTKTIRYAYDSIYEITEVYHVEGMETLEEFGYDAVGNRTLDAEYDDFSYNGNNQLTAYDSIAFAYDKNGNLTKKTENGTDETVYTFDYENRLTRIDYPDETYSAYKYDALGRRIEKRDRSGTIRRYVYDGHNMIAEYDGSNTLLASYVQGLGIDDPVSMYCGGGMYWYHKDALGSVYQMTDEDEATVRSYDYSAFGTIIAETGALENPFTYTAREYDQESGLYYYRARYYDAGVGRFLGRDPLLNQVLGTLPFAMFDDLLNLYPYVRNNPMNATDPLGLIYDPWKFKLCLAAWSVGCAAFCGGAAGLCKSPSVFNVCMLTCEALGIKLCGDKYLTGGHEICPPSMGKPIAYCP